MILDLERVRYGIVSSFVQSTEEDAYKDGAFHGRFTDTMSMQDALRIFINSPLVTNDEKANSFLPMYRLWDLAEKAWREIEKQGPPTSEDTDNLGKTYAILSNYCDEVFEADLRLRGKDVPDPFVIQRIGDDGKVNESRVVDADGKIKSFEGGEFGVMPGASTASNRARPMHAMEVTLGQKVAQYIAQEKSKDDDGKESENARATGDEKLQEPQQDNPSNEKGGMHDKGTLTHLHACWNTTDR